MAQKAQFTTGPAGSARVIGYDADGGIVLERHGDCRRHQLHRGCRIGPLGVDHRDHNRMLVAFEAGADGVPEQGATFVASISPDGLEALARDLLAAVAQQRAGRAIDMRFLI